MIYPWQDQQWQAILTRWQQQRLPHALLLSGPKGLGKLEFANAVAKRLLCQDTSNISICHHCASCHLMAAATHPDFFLLQPEADSKTIKIEAIRELLESLQQTAQQANQQIVIIEPAEAMNKAAANALLKTLEEPSGHITFLLVSHEIGTVPATIRSRCQKINFPIPPVATSLNWLKTQPVAESNAELLLALCENIPLRALAFAEDTGFAAHEQFLTQFIQFNKRQLTPLDMAKYCADKEQEQVLTALWTIITDLIRIQQSPTTTIAHSHQRATLTAIASQLSVIKLHRFLDQLIMAKQRMVAKINLNSALLWEHLFIEWIK